MNFTIIDILLKPLFSSFINSFVPCFLTLEVFIGWSHHDINKVRIEKIAKYEKALIKRKPSLEKQNIDELKEACKENVEKYKLTSLKEKLENFTDENNLEQAYQNLRTVIVKKRLRKLDGGSYSSVENKITVLFRRVIGHEFLHMASSKYDAESNILYSGFKQWKDSMVIGQGLNEGYTEMLSQRIYQNSIISSYKPEQKIARLLEFFFDNPKEMEKYYFHHDLPGFIQHMEKYASKEEIINLILELDNINLLACAGIARPPSLAYIKMQNTLYHWLKEKEGNSKKLEEMKTLICKNKICALTLNHKKMKLSLNKRYHLTEKVLLEESDDSKGQGKEINMKQETIHSKGLTDILKENPSLTTKITEKETQTIPNDSEGNEITTAYEEYLAIIEHTKAKPKTLQSILQENPSITKNVTSEDDITLSSSTEMPLEEAYRGYQKLKNK